MRDERRRHRLSVSPESRHGHESGPFSARLAPGSVPPAVWPRAECRRALYRARWPKSFHCPACGDRRRSSFRRGGQILYQRRACPNQATLISGTLLASTPLALTNRYLAISLPTSTRTKLAVLEWVRHLGVRYRTAWRLKHTIMQAMTEREKPRKLNGVAQIDEACPGWGTCRRQARRRFRERRS